MRLPPLILAAICILGIPSATVRAELSATKTLGPVRVTTLLAPDEPTIGDEITLEIRVEAEADVEVLMPEFGEALDRYSIIDFLPRRRIENDGSQVLTQRYTLQSVTSGDQSIPPILIEFVDHRPGRQPSPDDFDAYEVLTDRIDFHVASVLPDDASAELEPPLGELELRSEPSVGWNVVIAAGLLLLVVVGSAVFFVRWRRRAHRRNAYEIARARLDRLLEDQRLDRPQLTLEQFFVEISAVIRLYLEHRFDVRAPELTTDEFLQLAAAESRLSAEHQNLLGEFLQQADRVKFAGVGATRDQVRRSSDLAIRFLEETRENAPEFEEDELSPTAPTDRGQEAAHV